MQNRTITDVKNYAPPGYLTQKPETISVHLPQC
ncbi:hypothetical protein C826_01547 [Helicobacter bilis WiWa]|uniref:Uncharacterized protein n=1 Tax=Helicobacter bilis WiWa TaxID=1235804 RepID=N2BEC1_9HELI|nr:hypothetical protein C826_01547 [Helicobacter bilis WiWa]